MANFSNEVDTVLELFRDLALRPAISGMEVGNIRFIQQWANNHGILDKFKLEKLPGGLCFSVRQMDSLPSLVLTSHLDHPGFELDLLSEEAEGPRIYRAYPKGRVPMNLLTYSRVQLYNYEDQLQNINRPAPPRGFGHILVDKESTEEHPSFIIKSETDDNGRATHAVYDVPAMKIVNDSLYSRSLDDLLGVALCLSCMALDFGQKINLIVLFTRGEEDGATGFKNILMSRRVSLSDSIVAVEMAKFKNGVTPGKGIVLRTGDTETEYSSKVTGLLESVADELSDFEYQVSGASEGKTEAAAAIKLGYNAAATSIAMLGYHNAGDKKIVPESCSISDIESAARYLPELIKSFPNY